MGKQVCATRLLRLTNVHAGWAMLAMFGFIERSLHTQLNLRSTARGKREQYRSLPDCRKHLAVLKQVCRKTLLDIFPRSSSDNTSPSDYLYGIPLRSTVPVTPVYEESERWIRPSGQRTHMAHPVPCATDGDPMIIHRED